VVGIRPAITDDLGLVEDGWPSRRLPNGSTLAGGSPSTVALAIRITRGTGALFTFLPDQQAPPGVVGLSNVHQTFRTATLWYALGDARYGGRGLTTCAAAAMLRIAFDQLKLEAIHAWTVTHYPASSRILQKMGFSLIGRQRRSHRVDGSPCDRLLFDILSREVRADHVTSLST
jgi:RimJ/RimL family protein N-acetyltransferase